MPRFSLVAILIAWLSATLPLQLAAETLCIEHEDITVRIVETGPIELTDEVMDRFTAGGVQSPVWAGLCGHLQEDALFRGHDLMPTRTDRGHRELKVIPAATITFPWPDG